MMHSDSDPAAVDDSTPLEMAWDVLADAASPERLLRRAYGIVNGVAIRIGCTAAARCGVSVDIAEGAAAEVLAQVMMQGWAAAAGRDDARRATHGKIVAWMNVTIGRCVRRAAHKFSHARNDEYLDNSRNAAASGSTALAFAADGLGAATLRRGLESLARAAASARYAGDGPVHRRARETMIGALLSCFDRACGAVDVDQQVAALADGAPKGSPAWVRARDALYVAERRACDILDAWLSHVDGPRTADSVDVPQAPAPLTSWDALLSRIRRGEPAAADFNRPRRTAAKH